MGLTYYGISMHTGLLGGNPFVAFVLSGVVDLISGLLALAIIDYFGRLQLPTLYFPYACV